MNNLKNALNQTLVESRLKLQNLTARFPKLNEVIQSFIQKLDEKSERLQLSIKNYIKRLNDKSQTINRLLNSYSYQAILNRGFALVANGTKIITKAQEAQKQPKLQIRFSDGTINTIPLKNNNKKEKQQAETQPDFWSIVSTK